MKGNMGNSVVVNRHLGVKAEMKKVNIVYALIFKEDEQKVLMVNNKGSGWSLPGGEVEEGETLELAIIREAKEETGLTIEVERIVAVNEAFFNAKGHHALFITFSAVIVGGKYLIQDEEEILEIKWVDLQTANALMPYHPDGVERLLKSSSPYAIQV
jgi:8-oxo-dGTP diphosphatase